MDSLDGKVAIVTGGGSGIGQATARSLAKRGARVVVADINADAAEAVADEITGDGGDATPARCDVAGDTAFDDLRDLTASRYGGVDQVRDALIERATDWNAFIARQEERLAPGSLSLEAC